MPEHTAMYQPGANTWTPVPTNPLVGDHLSFTWTGAALFAFDSDGIFGSVSPGDAAAYDPASGHWVRLHPAPFGCTDDARPVWTGQQVLMYCPRTGKGSAANHDGLALTPRH